MVVVVGMVVGILRPFRFLCVVCGLLLDCVCEFGVSLVSPSQLWGLWFGFGFGFHSVLCLQGLWLVFWGDFPSVPLLGSVFFFVRVVVHVSSLFCLYFLLVSS